MGSEGGDMSALNISLQRQMPHWGRLSDRPTADDQHLHQHPVASLRVV